MFEMEVSLCKAFPAFTPILIRRERAIEVFKLIDRYTLYVGKAEIREKRKNMRPAGDNWF